MSAWQLQRLEAQRAFSRPRTLLNPSPRPAARARTRRRSSAAASSSPVPPTAAGPSPGGVRTGSGPGASRAPTCRTRAKSFEASSFDNLTRRGETIIGPWTDSVAGIRTGRGRGPGGGWLHHRAGAHNRRRTAGLRPPNGWSPTQLAVETHRIALSATPPRR